MMILSKKEFTNDFIFIFSPTKHYPLDLNL